jgi:transposase
MARTHPWLISDEFWSLVEPLVPPKRRDPAKTYRRKAGGGRKAVYGDRDYFAGIVYLLRAGVIWNAFPRKEIGGMCPSALHLKFQEWSKAGFFKATWRKGLAAYDEMEGISWKWQSADSTSTEAPLAQESAGPNPTDRGKKWKQAPRARGREWRPALVHRKRGKHA